MIRWFENRTELENLLREADLTCGEIEARQPRKALSSKTLEIAHALIFTQT